MKLSKSGIVFVVAIILLVLSLTGAGYFYYEGYSNRKKVSELEEQIKSQKETSDMMKSNLEKVAADLQDELNNQKELYQNLSSCSGGMLDKAPETVASRTLNNPQFAYTFKYNTNFRVNESYSDFTLGSGEPKKKVATIKVINLSDSSCLTMEDALETVSPIECTDDLVEIKLASGSIYRTSFVQDEEAKYFTGCNGDAKQVSPLLTLAQSAPLFVSANVKSEDSLKQFDEIVKTLTIRK